MPTVHCYCFSNAEDTSADALEVPFTVTASRLILLPCLVACSQDAGLFAAGRECPQRAQCVAVQGHAVCLVSTARGRGFRLFAFCTCISIGICVRSDWEWRISNNINNNSGRFRQRQRHRRWHAVSAGQTQSRNEQRQCISTRRFKGRHY